MLEKVKKIIYDFRIPLILSISLILFHTSTYYLVKFTPISAVVVGNSQLDKLIPFMPEWTLFYVLWHPLLIITPCFLYKVNKENFYTYIVIKFFIEVIAIFIFFFYPTLFIRPEFVVKDIFTWFLNLVYITDTPALNCMPSMHCTVCFTSIYSIIKCNKITKKCKAFFTLTFIGIVLSTLFVKQHAILDVVTAFILTAIISVIVYKLKLDKKFENYIEKK